MTATPTTPETVTYDPTHFHTHEELTDLLGAWAAAYPALMAFTSIGQSYEHRDIWAVTVTNTATGPADEKPALYVDGNMHAGEVTGCAVALHTLHYLLTGHGTDAAITDLLDTHTLYILPRVNPDGAEKYLTTPYTLRSSVRPYPDAELDEGLTPEDLDGDGRILQMRVPDAKGEWKISAHDPRLMLKRAPGDAGGQYYRVYTEGRLNKYLHGPVKVAKPLEGLDINRNYPGNWSATQRGGGQYPLSEPETRAVAAFVVAHPNICAILNYHTTGGVNLSPPCATSDATMPLKDREVYKALGTLAAEASGYPYISVYDAYPAVDERGTRSAAGGFIEWAWEGLGIWGLAPELWDIVGKAGVTFPDIKQKLLHDPSEEEGLALLKFNDEQLGGEGYIDWQTFDHPQVKDGLPNARGGGVARQRAVRDRECTHSDRDCTAKARGFVGEGTIGDRGGATVEVDAPTPAGTRCDIVREGAVRHIQGAIREDAAAVAARSGTAVLNRQPDQRQGDVRVYLDHAYTAGTATVELCSLAPAIERHAGREVQAIAVDRTGAHVHGAVLWEGAAKCHRVRAARGERERTAQGAGGVRRARATRGGDGGIDRGAHVVDCGGMYRYPR